MRPRYGYNLLFESLVAFADCIGLRHGPIYTLVMLVLGVACGLALMSIVNVMWGLNVVANPYWHSQAWSPKHYLLGLMCLPVLASAVLARVKLADAGLYLRMMPHCTSATGSARVMGSAARAGPQFVCVATGSYLVTLVLAILRHA